MAKPKKATQLKIPPKVAGNGKRTPKSDRTTIGIV